MFLLSKIGCSCLSNILSSTEIISSKFELDRKLAELEILASIRRFLKLLYNASVLVTGHTRFLICMNDLHKLGSTDSHDFLQPEISSFGTCTYTHMDPSGKC